MSADPYTVGEAKILIAQLVNMDPEDIDNFIVIAQGLCLDCGNRHAFSMLDTLPNLDAVIDFAAAAFHIRPPDQDGILDR